eukprot:TRINITY_DN5735_c0_g1_i1.p1 TRINITY_DN5735_c0_g1~~TRINITY_DN5735_c0_g1_i1.p1  ORF type:complete len:523 (+),score=129.82 TRINITY_DN5735_c0_g1_i1:34-1569(+)
MRAAVLLAVAVAAAALSRPVVDTHSGAVRGTDDGHTRIFLGIPYAEPPVGALRFRPAVPVEPWEGTRDASSARDGCLQGPGQPPGFPTSEDCLFLNIYTPATASPADPLPVFFWIHGGGDLYGRGAEYNGTSLAAHGLVVVTVNYRLGPLGFLQSEQLRAEDPRWPSLGGLNGVNDQRIALQWVLSNVGFFGGDPARVTIAGESAGSLSVGVHLISPLSRGRFDNAIMESGSCVGPWGPPAAEYGLNKSNALLQELGVATVQELRDLDATTIMQAKLATDIEKSVDGYVLQEQCMEAYTKGPLSARPGGTILLGANTQDSLLAPPYMHLRLNQSYVKAKLRAYFGNGAEQVETIYPVPADDMGATLLYVEMNADACSICPTRDLADLTVGLHNRTTNLYLFGYNPGVPSAAYRGLASHAAELGSVWNQTFSWNVTFPPDDAALTRTMEQAWASFVKTGNAWAPYQKDTEPYMFFDVASKMREGYKSKHCNFWKEYTADPVGLNQFVKFCWQ